MSASNREHKPRNIHSVATIHLLQMAAKYPAIQAEIKKVTADGWKIYVVSNDKGICRYRYRYITIPIWTFNKSPEYRIYYLAHELAHIFAGYEASHGPVFMEYFKLLCPDYLQHYEIEYKPRNAKAAGISLLGALL